jgi:hypothetical protein
VNCNARFDIAHGAARDESLMRSAQVENLRRKRHPAPAWRPFQLAFILLNIAGLSDRRHADREIADLLFFPTGGGKTEAYLGLALAQ